MPFTFTENPPRLHIMGALSIHCMANCAIVCGEVRGALEIYLDNAATSHPKPPEVTQAVVKALTDLNGNPGRSGHQRALLGSRCLSGCRQELSTFLGIGDPAELAFAYNCTDALNMAIRGCLHKGDHVVSTMLEHNSVLRPLWGLAQSGQIELTLLSPEGTCCITGSVFESTAQKYRARRGHAGFQCDGRPSAGCGHLRKDAPRRGSRTD